MNEITVLITIGAFFFTMMAIFIRPKGINEAIPATIGALVIMMSGSVSWNDLLSIMEKVNGAAITILATISMTIVLESFGFFRWAAANLVNKAKSGRQLFLYINMLCFFMTILFNNDGSILITTPIIILLLKNLDIKPHQKIPYLLSGALVATAASAPIGVSNIVNLIALKIIGMDLVMYTAFMFVPSIIGIFFMVVLLFFIFKKDIPAFLPERSAGDLVSAKNYHPLQNQRSDQMLEKQNRLMWKILIFVFIVRIGLFVASFFQFPIWIIAIMGSAMLLGYRWYRMKESPTDIIAKTPWHILAFAFSMYIIIYGLHNVGMTELLMKTIQPILEYSRLSATMLMGLLTTLLSNLFNNHPALMIGTMAITDLGLDSDTLRLMYLANIVGSDIGALFLPIGTLATLLWMDIVKKEGVKISWKTYIKTTIIVVLPTVFIMLLTIYFWTRLFL